MYKSGGGEESTEPEETAGSMDVIFLKMPHKVIHSDTYTDVSECHLQDSN